MKHRFALAGMTALLALAMCMVGCNDDDDGDGNGLCGTWRLTSFEIDGTSMDAETLGFSMEIEIDSDGTFSMTET